MLGLIGVVMGGRIGLAWVGDGQSWSNFVGERSGTVNEGLIRSSKSGRLMGRSDSVLERLMLVRGVRNRSYNCQSYWGWLGDGQIWSWQYHSWSLKVRVN